MPRVEMLRHSSGFTIELDEPDAESWRIAIGTVAEVMLDGQPEPNNGPHCSTCPWQAPCWFSDDEETETFLECPRGSRRASRIWSRCGLEMLLLKLTCYCRPPLRQPILWSYSEECVAVLGCLALVQLVGHQQDRLSYCASRRLSIPTQATRQRQRVRQR
jgi:hypothetical protein